VLTFPSLNTIVKPVISLLPQEDLRRELQNAFSEEHVAVEAIEEFFKIFPTAAWSRDLLCTFAHSWKSTHLKMLAIYGLSCRLQRSAHAATGPERSDFYAAAGHNAETSYEDLGLDFDGRTHAELYEDFAEGLIGDDSWTLRKYRLPEALRFSQWVYRNMVVEDIPVGLLTNMFSEIYNHGEYSVALPSVTSYFQKHTGLSEEQRKKALVYIGAHVEDDTEADHFLVVVEALNRYFEASGKHFDPCLAGTVFRAYLRNLAPVMRTLVRMMEAELTSHQASDLLVSAGGA
jgi:hypothetical protein